jgi:membrane protein implicated in regulation of membrane protease activity
MRKGVASDQIKAIAMAMVGGIVTAVATMFIPGAMLEGITGATGFSELIPAAAAPLGDTARAIIAFGAGAFMFALLSYILLRQDSAPEGGAALTVPSSEWAGEENSASSFKDRLARIKIPSVALPKMPWTKGEEDITELADLPRLRNGDSHPDAPPRRPLSAHQDLPVLDLGAITNGIPEAQEVVASEATEVASVPVMNLEPAEEVAPVFSPPTAASAVMPTDIQPTLAEMVAQLEAAVAERQKQLAELEAVAAQLGAGSTVTGQVSSQLVEIEELSPEPARAERPLLEAVPPSVKDDDMDSALAAALATLHRMNGTSG